MKLFNMDSPLMQFLNLVADVMIVCGLWIVTSLGVITIGASTSAAYYVLTRRISDRESYVVKDYFKAFKGNFVTATLVFITIVPLLLIAWLNILNIELYGDFQMAALPLNIVLAAELIFLYIHAFPLLSRFDLKYRQLMKSAFVMANKHLPTTIAHVVLLAGILLLCYEVPVVVLFAFGLYCWLSSYMLIRLYRKYRPEMDRDESEIETLKEANQKQGTPAGEGRKKVFSRR